MKHRRENREIIQDKLTSWNEATCNTSLVARGRRTGREKDLRKISNDFKLGNLRAFLHQISGQSELLQKREVLLVSPSGNGRGGGSRPIR